jgi:hypothetical protein
MDDEGGRMDAIGNDLARVKPVQAKNPGGTSAPRLKIARFFIYFAFFAFFAPFALSNS